jgi:hypothetical protein
MKWRSFGYLWLDGVFDRVTQNQKTELQSVWLCGAVPRSDCTVGTILSSGCEWRALAVAGLVKLHLNPQAASSQGK